MNRNDRRHFKKGDFMKRQLTVALGLAVLATPAFATKARLQALGEDNYGSQYINDNRNIWLNAAQINNHKDLVTFEWGDNSNTADSAATPRSEGGVYKTMGNMVYGVHLGGVSTTANALRAAAGLDNGNEENNIDLFVGGDAGMKWGANIGYARTKNDNSATAFPDENGESLRTRLGVIMGDTQAYANINLVNNAQSAAAAGGTKAEFEGNVGFQVGAIHAWEGNSVFVDYRNFKGESNVDGTKNDLSFNRLEAGIGRVTRLNDKANLFTKASWTMTKAENDLFNGVGFGAGNCGTGNAALGCEEYDAMNIPVVIGLETEATSWLTLRASIAQTIWGSEEDADDERGFRQTTVVNAGATLKFGELSVDGVIGNSIDGSAATDNTNSGELRTDNLMTRVGMTYRF
jgi:hypothetical protein